MSVLQAERRGSTKPAHLRKQGLLPMALLDRSQAVMLIQASETDLRKAVAAADGLGRLDLEVKGEKPRKVIIKQIDKDFVKQQILNVTLIEVGEDDMVKMDIPVVATGTPTALGTSDAVLSHGVDHLKLRGKMSSMPERVEVDVTNLEVGHHINAGDITLPEGIELLSSADATVFTLQAVKEPVLEVVEETPAAEEGAEAAGDQSSSEEASE